MVVIQFIQNVLSLEILHFENILEIMRFDRFDQLNLKRLITGNNTFWKIIRKYYIFFLFKTLYIFNISYNIL